MGNINVCGLKSKRSPDSNSLHDNNMSGSGKMRKSNFRRSAGSINESEENSNSYNAGDTRLDIDDSQFCDPSYRHKRRNHNKNLNEQNFFKVSKPSEHLRTIKDSGDKKVGNYTLPADENVRSNAPMQIYEPFTDMRLCKPLLESLKKWVPGFSPLKNVKFMRKKFPKLIPYVSGAILGFSKFQRQVNDTGSIFRPKINHNPNLNRYHNVPTQSTSKYAHDSGKLCSRHIKFDGNSENHVNWWRYTFFILQDPWNTSLVKKRIAETGGLFVSLETHTGCEIKFCEQLFIHRGHVVQKAFIDGPTKKAIFKCKSSLPKSVLNLIVQINDEVCSRDSMNENCGKLYSDSMLTKLEKVH